MGDACRALDYPIVSGNVSLYNESKATGGGSAILPTPAIGGVGLMLDHTKMATIKFKAPGDVVWLIGPRARTLASRCGCARSPAARKAPPPPWIWRWNCAMAKPCAS
jgi:phosphoribosylformylglycinamidine synthase